MCAMLVLFYASVTVEGAAFDDNCTINSNCTEIYNECSSSKCACNSGSFRNTTGNECVIRKSPGAACSTGECVTNANCNITCICNTGYTATTTSCESSDAAIIIAHMYVFIFGIVASLYFLV